MSGQLVLLTPIHSPMVTRPPSPAASALPDQLCLPQDWPTDVPASAHASAAPEGEEAAGDLQASASSSPKSPVASPARAKKWKSPPCCDGCGAAKASGGQCSGCKGMFCASCMSTPAAIADTVGSAGSSNGSHSSSAGHNDKGPCSNCSSLCNNCKPVACCFCEELRQQSGASRLCEACAGVCDACQRAACGLCKAEFSSCSACGYAACEDCRLQLQLQYGASGSADVGTLVGPSGAVSCWCAPPLRMASNVRHVSSQRYQMAQLHPSFLACSMEAAGLRDADYDEDDDDFDVTYDNDDVIMGHMVPDADLDHTNAGPHSSGGGSSLGHRMTSQGLGSLLCPKTLEAAIGSLPGLSSHLSLPLSPSGSSHSSAGHYAGVLGHAHGVAGARGYAGGLRHPEHSLRGWLDSSN